MRLLAFSAVNLDRCQSPSGFNHSIRDWSLSDWLTATAGELGEAANIIKKLNRHRDNTRGNQPEETEAKLRNMLEDELADVFIYLDLLATAAGVSLEHAVIAKFNKTSEKIGYQKRI